MKPQRDGWSFQEPLCRAIAGIDERRVQLRTAPVLLADQAFCAAEKNGRKRMQVLVREMVTETPGDFAVPTR
jgi:ABC-type thiamine transport system ATPase subunit